MATAQMPTESKGLYAAAPFERRQRSALFLTEGKLVRFRALPVTDKDGKKQYLHDVTLFQADSNRYLKCVMFREHVVDLRKAINETFPFEVSDLRLPKEERYGTKVGRDIPAVVMHGSFPADVIEMYEDKTLVLE